ncbi:SWIM zinc finger family protein [Microlunatus ginsengisoli]
MTEAVLTYRAASTAAIGAVEIDLLLSASSPDPSLFFDGFLLHAEQAAVALLQLAKVARTRFYLPPSMVAARIAAADPVVTASADRLRFESFSLCCGVAARFDALSGGLDRPPASNGTTNVDLNPPVRDLLADVRGDEPLHLAVGTNVTVTTMTASVVEHRVPLSTRWVRGFAEAQASSAALARRFTVPAGQARRFVRGLPATSGSRSVLYVIQGRDGLRLTATSQAGSVPLGGANRLRTIEPLLGYADSLTVYGPATPGSGVSSWQVDLPDGRFVLTLSPNSMRGFSGEGGLLFDLADDQAADDALVLSTLLDFTPVIDPTRIARLAGLDVGRIRPALAHLAAAGRVGYDAAEGAYFTRALPWDRTLLETMHPRLADARALVHQGAVTVSGDRATVTSAGNVYVLRRSGDSWICSCPWHGQHGGSRGPCKHVLAVSLLASDLEGRDGRR